MIGKLTKLNKERKITVIFDGSFITICKLSKMFSIPYDVLYNRIVYRHEDINEAIYTPIRGWERRRI